MKYRINMALRSYYIQFSRNSVEGIKLMHNKQNSEYLQQSNK